MHYSKKVKDIVKYDTIIFDLDDTLVLENDFIKSGFKAAAIFIENEYGISFETSYQLLLELHNRDKRNVFNRFLSENNIDSYDAVKDMVRVYKNHRPEISLLPDASHILGILKSQNVKLGIITDGDVSTQKNKLKAIHAEDFFDAVVVSDEFGIENRKPSEIPYRECLRMLGIKDFARAVYVGDNISKDFITAKRLRLLTVQIERDKGLYCSISYYTEEYLADFKIKDLRELLEIINM